MSAEPSLTKTQSEVDTAKRQPHRRRTSLLNLRRFSTSPFPFGTAELARVSDEHKGGEVLREMGGLESLASSIGSHPERGITGDPEHQIPLRKKIFGTNTVREPPRKTYLNLLWEALKDTTLIILSVAAVVSLGLSFASSSKQAYPCDDFNPHNKTEAVEGGSQAEFLESIAILAAVVIVSNVTATNDYSKERQFRKLNEASRSTDVVQVIRGGRRSEIHTRDIVVGDVVLLTVGDKVPADGVVTTSEGFSCDESSLTGEPDLQKKPISKYMKAGALVSEGYGQFIVTAVGEHTDSGKAMALLSAEEPDPTPLQNKLDRMATQIGKLGLSFAAITFLSVVIRFIICRNQETGKFKGSELKILLNYIILAITIVVVSIPEGLPLAVTISLAYSMKQMMEDQNLVRKLEACETMGGATNICSDKTGTLTENRMTVTEAHVFGQFQKPIPNRSAIPVPPPVLDVLIESLAINTLDASYVQLSKNGIWEFRGNKTECALLVMCQDLGGEFAQIREGIVRKKQRLRSVPFTSDRKRMTTVVGLEDKYRVHTKGAAEIVLGLCTQMVDPNGQVVPLDAAMLETYKTNIQNLARTGLRTICIGYKEIPSSPGDHVANVAAFSEEFMERDLIMIAIAGIKDPVRASVPAAVASCKRAGITVRMVTGDNLDTARHIARECGILDDTGIAMEGGEFRELSHEGLLEILPRLQVLARSKPTDKYILVSKLRELGEVVAVTGDGTNDAPALKEADVGLAMGITGTDIAKKASDIIILDDNFSSIVKSVMWGRNVYDSVRKFLQFQLTVNMGALAIAYVGAVVNSRSPLSPVQLLWVNLIMDTLAALALATERPSPDLLLRQPYGRYDSLVSARMWMNIVGQAFLQISILLIMLFHGNQIFATEERHLSGNRKTDVTYTMVFNTFVFLQLFNEINARRLDTKLNIFAGFFSNSLFVGVLILTIILQVLIVEFGGDFFQVTQLTGPQFMISFAIGAASVPWGAMMKFINIEVIVANYERRQSQQKVNTLNSANGASSPLSKTEIEMPTQ
eukprot:c13054_g1_i2.p1 GENE.c13054_g1_i2~~c13054_g1_i2.p1  ORF type:complete len:1035 (-),score=195.20 c13054_g1_i2:224-3328(-)